MDPAGDADQRIDEAQRRLGAGVEGGVEVAIRIAVDCLEKGIVGACHERGSAS